MIKPAKLIQILAILLLSVSILTPVAVATSPAEPRMSEVLAETIAKDPGRMVRVIVQKANDSGQAERYVQALGGDILKELDLIQAFAARLPANNIPRLARHQSVSLVTLDAPVRSTALTTATVRDEFNAISFSNNDGTANWAGGWQEINESDGPDSGDVEIHSDLGNNRLQIRDNDGGGEGVQRQVDLSGAASAVLSFDFRRQSLDEAGDYVAVEISMSGTGWTELVRFAGPGNDSVYQTWSGDVGAYLSSNTAIRFISSSSLGRYDTVFFDNVQIEYTLDDPVEDFNSINLNPTEIKYVADDFEAVPAVFENNSGTDNWASAWKEVGENDGPEAGHIQIEQNDDKRSLRFEEDRLGIWRMVDLSGATDAKLSFEFGRKDNEDDNTDYMVVEVSSDGGATWTAIGKALAAYNGDMDFEMLTYDISDYISSNTAMSFTIYSMDDELEAPVYLDDVMIVYDVPSSPQQVNYYLDTLGVQRVWSQGLDGSGVTVAVVDSGITPDADFGFPYNKTLTLMSSAELSENTRILSHQVFSGDTETAFDNFGHGTHVAGIIAGNGYKSGGIYMGVAPMANLISLKVSDDFGMGYESDTVAALQWIFDNKDSYNIRVVNLSIQSTVEQSYHDSALDAAAEILWFNGVVVVAAAGNKTEDTDFDPIMAAPANDPFIITVGATNEKGDSYRGNDVIAAFSSYAETLDFYIKPDIHAPGKDIISVLASSSWWRNDYPDRFIKGGYFRISGTSMATPMVAGTIALLLQDEPDLTPDQVKYRLMETAGKVGKGKYLDAYAAITIPTIESANQGVIPHMLLAKMALIAYWATTNGGENIDWDAVDWDAVNWNAVNWNAVNWNAVNWNAVNWNAVNWNAVNWNAVNWNAVNWNAVNWNAVNWNAVNWNAVNWNAVNWNALYWGE